MEGSAITVQDGYALGVGDVTVTAVHTVVWPVVPVAWVDVDTLCPTTKQSAPIP